MKKLISTLCITYSVFVFQAVASDPLNIATSKLGSEYILGYEGADVFDCSGLTQYAFAHFGVELPRRSRDQALVGVPVARDDIRRGDLLFFGNSAADAASGIVGHVGIAESNNSMINAVGYDEAVVRTSLLRNWGRNWFISARRVATNPASTRFSVGDTVVVTEDRVSLRDLERDWTRVGRRDTGDRGVIRAAPLFAQDNWRWEVEFSDETGWVAEQFLSSGGTLAESITATFRGRVNSITAFGAEAYPDIEVGDTIRGSYRLDPNARNLRPDDRSLGLYGEAITDVEIRVGSYRFREREPDELGISNNRDAGPSGLRDGYSFILAENVRRTSGSLGDWDAWWFALSLFDSSRRVFSSIEIPRRVPDPSDFDTAVLRLSFRGPGIFNVFASFDDHEWD